MADTTPVAETVAELSNRAFGELTDRVADLPRDYQVEAPDGTTLYHWQIEQEMAAIREQLRRQRQEIDELSGDGSVSAEDVEEAYREGVNDLRARLDRLEAILPAPVQPRLSQPGGLDATHNAVVVLPDGATTRPAHPLDHGPDVDPNYLRNQVNSSTHPRTIAAQFTDRAVMERVIAEAIEAHAAAIDAWLDSAQPGDPLPFDFEPGAGNMGRGYYRNEEGDVGEIPTDSLPLDRVRVVLIATGGQPVRLGDGTEQLGRRYIIQTAFPFNATLARPLATTPEE
jgi:hypothetical protein